MRREAVTYPKWWGKLDYEEQKEYIHDHPGTQLRTTAVRPESSKVKSGTDPITAERYVLTMVHKNNPNGPKMRKTVDMNNKRIFEGAKTLQDIVDKYEDHTGRTMRPMKVVKVREKKKDTAGIPDTSNRDVVLSDKPMVVGNEAQKILFLTEMQGQMSDGMRENRGDGGRQFWDLDWDSVGVGDNIGRKFWAGNDRYNFANKELIDIVGDRMLMKVNLYTQDYLEHLLAFLMLIPYHTSSYVF